MIVVFMDQRRSTHSPDAVPSLLRALSGTHPRLGFERTAGDEIQALFKEPEAALEAVEIGLRHGGFSIGLGLGEVEHPLPEIGRAARGPAYRAAAQALEAAKGREIPLALVHHLGTARQQTEEGERADALLWPWGYLVGKRTERQWVAVALSSHHRTQKQASAAMGISPQAFSQLLRGAHQRQADRAKASLAEELSRSGALAEGAQPAEIASKR